MRTAKQDDTRLSLGSLSIFQDLTLRINNKIAELELLVGSLAHIDLCERIKSSVIYHRSITGKITTNTISWFSYKDSFLKVLDMEIKTKFTLKPYLLKS